MVGHENIGPPACREFEQDLVLYYYGELSGSEHDFIESHINDCRGCALSVQRLGSLLPMTVETDEPPPDFWDNYSREMRHKLAEVRERQSWWRRWASSFRPWAIPALATTAVIAVALTLTLGKALWAPRGIPVNDEAFMEVLPMTENLEFFKTMDLLDALDFLEDLGNSAQGSA
jgi:predicted anti-sigma-YlaC factor YlaD